MSSDFVLSIAYGPSDGGICLPPARAAGLPPAAGRLSPAGIDKNVAHQAQNLAERFGKCINLLHLTPQRPW
jgi:hypothetical protein